jgi:hypothetical protein
MSLNIVQVLRGMPSYEAARLIGSAPQFITDFNLINTLNQFDLNNKRNDAALIRQINMFAGVPGLKDQVAKWLAS